MISRIIISTILSALLTPLLIKFWIRIAPIENSSRFDKIGKDQLRSRNAWIDYIVTALMLIGLSLPLFLYKFKIGPQNFWPIGLGFGLMVILPVLFISLVTLIHGTERFYEFWRYYEVKWGVGLKGIRLVYIPIAILGLVSLVMIIIGI